MTTKPINSQIEELKKQIISLKNKVYKRLGSKETPKEYIKYKNWEEFYCGELIEKNTKLTTLQEAQSQFLEDINKVIEDGSWKALLEFREKLIGDKK